MDNSNDLKKLFLRILMFALSIGGITGIAIFLFGSFGPIEVKILFSTLIIGLCSLTGLATSTIYLHKNYQYFSLIGICLSFVCVLFSLYFIWLEAFQYWQSIISIFVLSASFAHASLLLNVKKHSQILDNILVPTLTFVGIVSIMLLVVINLENMRQEYFYRLLGVFAILDVLGTLLVPIVNNISNTK